MNTPASQSAGSIALALLVGLGAASAALGAGSDFAEAMRVRRLIILEPGRADPAQGEVVMLPVSRGFDQRDTSLCWAYATLSGLETALRVRQPGSTVELSRRTMQVHTIRDRWLAKLHQTASYTGERGVAVDAMRLIAASGLVAFSDFADVDDPYGSFDIAHAVGAAAGLPAQVHALVDGLARVYGVPPLQTHHQAEPTTTQGLAATVVAGQVWESYAIAHDGVEGYRPHPDPDARSGARSWFMPRARLVERIRASLEAGSPVELTIGGHCVLIHGAAYDQAWNPLRYHIKDSYPGYFYKADPERIMRNLVEITTAR